MQISFMQERQNEARNVLSITQNEAMKAIEFVCRVDHEMVVSNYS